MSTFTQEQIIQIRELILEELKENLRFSFETKNCSDYYGSGTTVKAVVSLGDETLAESDFIIYKD